jgi:uncharacterized membrane-anchored protein YhcB (DUF1043 family)
MWIFAGCCFVAAIIIGIIIVRKDNDDNDKFWF